MGRRTVRRNRRFRTVRIVLCGIALLMIFAEGFRRSSDQPGGMGRRLASLEEPEWVFEGSAHPNSYGDVLITPAAYWAKVLKGDSWTYRFQRAISMGWQEEGTPEETRLELKGKVFVKVLEKTPEHLQMVFGFDLKKPTPLQSSYYHAWLSPEGKLIRLERPEGFEPSVQSLEAESIMQDLIAQWCFFHSEDSFGPYQAQLTSSTGYFGKAKVRYQGQSATSVKIVRSQHEWKWNEKLRMPSEISGEETVEVALFQTHLKHELSYHFEAVKQDLPRKLTQLKPRSLSAESNHFIGLVPQIQSFERTASHEPSRTTHDWKQLKKRFQQVTRLKAAEELQLFDHLLKAIHRSAPKTAELAQMVQNSKPASRKYALGIGVLATDGSPEAQNHLRSLYRAESLNDPLAQQKSRETILTALTTTDANLTHETRDLLLDEARKEAAAEESSVKMGALLALGSYLKKTADLEAKEAVRDWFQQERSREEILIGIDAVGNSGEGSFYPLLVPYLKSEDTTLRTRAVFSLRWMETPESAHALVQASLDSANSVRQAAYEAATFQKTPHPEVTQAIQKCAESEPSSQIRRICQAYEKPESP